MAQIIKLVFSDYRYIVLSAVIFFGMVIPLLIISEYIFLEPYLVAHLPANSELGFLLILAVSAMSGLVLSMNVYRIKMVKSNSKKKMSGGILGTIIGSVAGACSCGPIGFAVISTFGSIGGVATAFLSNYEIPLRFGALAILGITYYTTTRSLSVECKINN